MNQNLDHIGRERKRYVECNYMEHSKIHFPTQC